MKNLAFSPTVQSNASFDQELNTEHHGLNFAYIDQLVPDQSKLRKLKSFFLNY